MKIKYVCMRRLGKQKDRSEIGFQKQHAQPYILELRDTTDQGLHRMSRIARVTSLSGASTYTLLDAQVLWREKQKARLIRAGLMLSLCCHS
jgi:hypothetical protein